MPIQQVSFQNTPITKQNQQSNAAFTPVATNTKGDTVEISAKKKENKALKYTLIGVGALATVITAVNHKKIKGLFNNKSPLVPVEDILKSAKIEDIFIEKSEGRGYQLWHFTSKNFLNEFINAHADLSHIKNSSNDKKFLFYNLKSIKENSSNKYVNQFIKAVKSKTGVDLEGEIKHYRFIGQSELDAIKTKMPVNNPNYHGYSYVTLCPDYGLSCNDFDYRVTYKNTPNVLDNLDYYHDTQYKNGIKKPYSHADVEKVEKLVDGKWQKVEY